MNEQLRGRQTVLQEEVLLQFTPSSWNGFNRLVPISGVQAGGDVRGSLVQALEAELWVLQEGNNLLLLTRGFTIPCTLKENGPSTYLLAHSCRPTTDADAVNAFRDGVLIKGRWSALLPDEVPGASQGAASLCRCVFEDSPLGSDVAARVPTSAPVTNAAQQPAIVQGASSGVIRTIVEPVVAPVLVAVQADAVVPSPVAASFSAPAQPTAPSFSMNPVDLSSASDLSSNEGPENISQPVVSSAEPLFRLGELNASTKSAVTTQVSMTESGSSSDKVSIEYRLEGPQEAVGQLLKQQGLANQPKSELTSGSPRVPEVHETPAVMQPAAAPIPAATSRLPQWPNSASAQTANNAGSMDAWSKPTSSVTLSQAAIDAILSSIPGEPSSVPAPPVIAAIPSSVQPPMMNPRIEVPAPQPAIPPRVEVPAMAQPQVNPAMPVRPMPVAQPPVQRLGGQASILQPAVPQAQARLAAAPVAGNARAALDEPMLSQKDIDELVKRLSGNN